MLRFDELFEAFASEEEKNDLNLLTDSNDFFWERLGSELRNEDEFERAFGKPKKEQA